MKFLIDECVGLAVARWLRKKNFDVVAVIEEFSGVSDDEVLKRAVRDGRILITKDKDFGEMVFRNKKQHCGIILLRLVDERSENKIKVLEQVIESYAEKLERNFVVASEFSIRVIESVLTAV